MKRKKDGTVDKRTDRAARTHAQQAADFNLKAINALVRFDEQLAVITAKAKAEGDDEIAKQIAREWFAIAPIVSFALGTRMWSIREKLK